MPCLLVAKFVGKCWRNCRCRTQSVISAYQLAVCKLYVILSVNVGSLVPLCLQGGFSVELLFFFSQILNITSHYQDFFFGLKIIICSALQLSEPSLSISVFIYSDVPKGFSVLPWSDEKFIKASFACFAFWKVSALKHALDTSPVWCHRGHGYHLEGTTKHQF